MLRRAGISGACSLIRNMQACMWPSRALGAVPGPAIRLPFCLHFRSVRSNASRKKVPSSGLEISEALTEPTYGIPRLTSTFKPIEPSRWKEGMLVRLVEERGCVYDEVFQSDLAVDKNHVPSKVLNAFTEAGDLHDAPGSLLYGDFGAFIRRVRRATVYSNSEMASLELSEFILDELVGALKCPAETVSYEGIPLVTAGKEVRSRPDLTICLAYKASSVISAVIIEVKRPDVESRRTLAQACAYAFGALQKNFQQLDVNSLSIHICVQIGTKYSFYRLVVNRQFLKDFVESGVYPPLAKRAKLLRYDRGLVESNQLDVSRLKDRVLILAIFTKYLKMQVEQLGG